jgi:glycolate oxidase iron-sulfur subunit
VERNFERDAGESTYRRLVFELFTHPGRLRAAAPLVALSQRTGLAGLARRPRLRRLAPRLTTLAGLAPDASVRRSLRRLPRRYEAKGQRRGSVALLQGCVQRVFFGHVNEATAEVLAAEGYEVHAPRAPRCCGALQLHSGDDRAVELAKETIAALESYDTVVVNAAGCGSAMKDYGHVLREDPEWAERAVRFAEKVKDVTEVLAEDEPRAERHPLKMKLAYHDACHLAHAQKVRDHPRKLLRSIPDLELVEPGEWEICCGSAGVYNLLQPEPAAELGERKARNLIDSGAEAVAAANPGCALQITTHSARLGRALPVYHPLELLARSIAGRS